MVNTNSWEVIRIVGYFICGTDTDVGKTVATVLLGQVFIDAKLGFDFYKPVQSGGELVNDQLVAPDVEWYKTVLAEKESRNTYLFEEPSSPHYAASIEGKSINVNQLVSELKRRASGTNYLLAEGAGGLYVPLNNEGYCVIDLIQASGFPAIIIARTGVGTINHTLLTVEALRTRGIPIKGIIFSSTQKSDKRIVEDNMTMIQKLTKLPIIGSIPYTENLEDKLRDQHFRSSIISTWNIEYLKMGDQHASSTIG